MEHYYTNNPTSASEERVIEYKIKDKTIKLTVDNGVFSKYHVDIATNFMLNTIIDTETIKGKVLDLGCGYGAIGITLAKFYKDLDITMVDINERALGLAKKNCKLNALEKVNIIESDGFSNVKGDFDFIITNPPIRAGKQVIYKMYQDAYEHLKNGGVLYLVINKKHGAPSTKEFLEELFGNCEVLDKKAGFNVIKCEKTAWHTPTLPL